MLRPFAAACLAVLTLAAPVGAAMPTVKTRAPVERLASYEPQTTCSPTAKTGVSRFSASVLKSYPGTGSYGIVRGCAVGGRSEHKEGRAWDWAVNADDSRQRAQAHDLMRWLFATDATGQRAANARRVGLMYLIFDRRIWSAYAGGTGWRAYSGANPHTDHMHLSFSWAGAKGSTSWFRVVAPPAPVRALPTPPRGAAPPAPRPLPKPAGPVAQPAHDHDHEGGWRPSDRDRAREKERARREAIAERMREWEEKARAQAAKGKGRDRAAEREAVLERIREEPAARTEDRGRGR
jgi:hypothetical protein